MNKTDRLLQLVAETIYEEEGLFYATLFGEDTILPLEGTQRLVFGGAATPDLKITEEGISASISINHIHYDVDLPWRVIFAVEGTDKAFYCRRKTKTSDDEGDSPEKAGKEHPKKRKASHLKVIK
jgi:hypothetical protein